MLAIEAGCDGVLICSGDHDAQAAALEALVHAVEDERLPLSRVEDALQRQRRAKERFLAAPRRVAPARGQGAARAARPRRAPRHRRRDGAVPVMLKPRAARARRSARRRRAGQSVSRARNSTGASTRSAGSGSSRSTTNRCSRGARYVAGAPEVRAAAIQSRVARSRRLPASIGVRGGYGSAQLLPLLDRRRRRGARASRSSATAISRRSSRS